jgi:enolase
MISGGLHANRNMDFQDYMVIPVGAKSFSESLEWLTRMHRRLGDVLREAGYEGYLTGDEGGYGPRVKSNREGAELLVRAIEASGLRPGKDVTIALDVASSHFFDATLYQLRCGSKAQLGSSEMIDLFESLAHDFPLVSIEDPLQEDDWPAWRDMTSRLGDQLTIVGDDFLSTNPERIRRAVAENAANAVLIKPNQVGTLSDTLSALHIAESAGWKRIVSARSGESEDAFIADLAVGVAADYIKIGSVVRGERTAKYNRLLRIAEEFEG